MTEPDATPLATELMDLTRRREALSGRVAPLPPSTRIVALSNQKGGVGKTTTTVNIASALARLGARVLVIDLDPQGNASTALGIEHHAKIPGIYEVITGAMTIASVLQQSPGNPNLTCVPATINLAGAEIELVPASARETRLKRALEEYLASVEQKPHYIFIDCPPSLGLLTINAWTAAREILVPIQCEYYALEGVDQLLKYIELVRQQLNPKLELSTVLLTMYDGRTRLAEDVVNFVREKFPTLTLNSVIPRAVRVSEAPSFNRTVITHDRRSPGSVAYLEAAIEIATRGAQLGR